MNASPTDGQLSPSQTNLLALAMVKHAGLQELWRGLKEYGGSDAGQRAMVGGGIGAGAGGLLGALATGELGPALTAALLGGGAGAAGGHYLPQLQALFGGGGGEPLGNRPPSLSSAAPLGDRPLAATAQNPSSGGLDLTLRTLLGQGGGGMVMDPGSQDFHRRAANGANEFGGGPGTSSGQM